MAKNKIEKQIEKGGEISKDAEELENKSQLEVSTTANAIERLKAAKSRSVTEEGSDVVTEKGNDAKDKAADEVNEIGAKQDVEGKKMQRESLENRKISDNESDVAKNLANEVAALPQSIAKEIMDSVGIPESVQTVGDNYGELSQKEGKEAEKIDGEAKKTQSEAQGFRNDNI